MTYYQMSTKLAVTNGQDQMSQAVPMGGDNAVQTEATIFALGGAASLGIEIQGSSDMQNWSTIQNNSGLGYGYNAPAKTTGISFPYVRYKYSVAGVGTVLVAAGLNTSFQ